MFRANKRLLLIFVSLGPMKSRFPITATFFLSLNIELLLLLGAGCSLGFFWGASESTRGAWSGKGVDAAGKAFETI